MRNQKPKTSLRRNHAQTVRRLEQREVNRIEVEFTAAQVDCPGRSPGRRWVAELVDKTGHLTVPKCIAWLTDYTPTMPMILDFLIVPFEEDRRLGYGRRMVDECRKRWPALIYTDPCTPAGEKFSATLPEFELRDEIGGYTLDGPAIAQSTGEE